MGAGRFYASAEGVVLLLALIVSGDLTHLTWWAITILAVHDFYIALFGTVNCRLWTAATVLSSIVQVVVVLMSLMRCNLLRDAYHEVGPWTYLVGNFVLHYWPTLRLISSRPSNSDFVSAATTPMRFDTARIIAVYATLQEPASVYMCGQVMPWSVLPAGVIAAAVGERVLLWCCVHL